MEPVYILGGGRTDFKRNLKKEGKTIRHLITEAGKKAIDDAKIDPAEIQAVEASILWHTEGKGEDDLGVHFFERRLPSDADDGDLRPLRRLKTRLPNSPLSYRGAILSIEWCVRLRLFLRRGREYAVEQPFTLGSVPAILPAVVREPDEEE